MLSKILDSVRQAGPLGVYRALHRRVFRTRRAFTRHRDAFAGRRGLELGGPSPMFGARGPLPLYALAAGMDCCNFSRSTAWDGEIDVAAGFRIRPSQAPGRIHIAEAAELVGVSDGAYEFVAACHVIEHLANPLKALREWIRVLEPGGVLLLVFPHKDATFDHRRPVTPLAHMIEDFERGVGEDDLTHLPEILELHDLSMDPAAGDPAAFEARSLKNLENRCLHQHVFDTGSAAGLVRQAGLTPLEVDRFWEGNILILARKPTAAGETPAP